MPSPRTLSGWGRLGVPGRENRSEDLERATEGAVLTRGLGRAYGDAALPPPGVEVVVGSARADRFLALDPSSGSLRAEAGLSLYELNRRLLPRGWFVPVTPGTQFVTLGGMVAADVHGKNHHREGTIGRHVAALRIRTGAHGVVDCTPDVEGDLFRATIGGMGLTGHVLEVELPMQRVESAWIDRESVRTDGLEASISALEELGERWPYTVAWLDGLARGGRAGRGIVEGGDWCAADRAPGPVDPVRPVRDIPLEAPNWLLSPLSMGLYNQYRWRRHVRRRRRGIVHPTEFFYPLDGLGEWNRLYGPRGFTQYQCVLPRAAGPAAVRRFLDHLREQGGTPFLIVLKDFGAEGDGILSFPEPGMTLAIDLPVDAETPDLVGRLNELVIAFGGRIYLAKDQFTRREHFERMEGDRVERFREIRHAWDPESTIQSALGGRLGL